MSFTNDLEQMKKDFETQIQALSKNEVLVTKIKDDSKQLERRMSSNIIKTKEEVLDTITKEIHTVTVQVKEVESKVRMG